MNKIAVFSAAVALLLLSCASEAREHPLKSFVGRSLYVGLPVGLDKIRLDYAGSEEIPSKVVFVQADVRASGVVGRDNLKARDLVRQEQFQPEGMVGVDPIASKSVLGSEEVPGKSVVGRSSLPSAGISGSEPQKTSPVVGTEPSYWGTE